MVFDIKTSRIIPDAGFNQPFYSGKSSLVLLIAFSILLLICGRRSEAQTTFEWPSFHGPDRSNKSSETGFLKEWLKGASDHSIYIFRLHWFCFQAIRSG